MMNTRRRRSVAGSRGIQNRESGFMNGLPYSEAELRDLVERGEGQFLEFKSAWDRSGGRRRTVDRRAVRDAIAESVAAFANADGGTLLVGVEDDGTPSGHGYPDDAVADLLAVPRRRLQPDASCRTGRCTVDGVEILVFEVAIAPEAVMIDGNGFPYRVGDRIVRQPQEAINQRKEAYRQVGYERRFRHEATLDDLDLGLAQTFLDRTPIRGTPVVRALERYRLVEWRGRERRLTNAALLLFARHPAIGWHPRAGIRMFRVAGTERRHGPRRNVTQLCRIDPPLATALDTAITVARAQIRRDERLEGSCFNDSPEYPDFAWREAMVNAVAHRDYELQGRETEIWFYDDRMEVCSPGGIFPPVTEMQLRRRRPAHATRNPLLVRVLADASFMRDEGEGIPRIFEEMERRSLRLPEITARSGVFSISLFNDRAPVRRDAGASAVVREAPPAYGSDALIAAGPGFEDDRTLRPGDRVRAQQRLLARIPALRDHFARHPRLARDEYRRRFRVTRHTATRELDRLVAQGYLAQEAGMGGSRYVPRPALDRDAPR